MELNRTHMESTQDKLKSGYDALLLGYATGVLDQAQKLAVDAHISYSDTAKEFIYSCEAIGGALIENHCESIEMKADSLKSVLTRLDNPCDTASCKDVHPIQHSEIKFALPDAISEVLEPAIQDFKWGKPYPGFKSYDLDLDCDSSKARFLQANPGVKSPHHSHAGTEITLVLDGAFSDETGDYKTGDLIVTDETFNHAPIACKMQGCTCFVVTTAPIKLTGIASLLNPFLKR